MKLYHGSYTEVREPLVRVGRRALDFGPGFYVTSLKEHAEKWAKRVCVIRNLHTPTLNVYQFDERILHQGQARVLSLPNYNQEWLEFIVASRRGEEPWKDYDIVEGGVANDQVIDTVEDFYAGRITVEQALGLLRFARPTHQMCILNQEVVDRNLIFIESKQLI